MNRKKDVIVLLNMAQVDSYLDGPVSQLYMKQLFLHKDLDHLKFELKFHEKLDLILHLIMKRVL
jgi:hypothetical protein